MNVCLKYYTVESQLTLVNNVEETRCVVSICHKLLLIVTSFNQIHSNLMGHQLLSNFWW